MKKTILFGAIMALYSTFTVAQVNPHAIGIRSGSSNFGGGHEISYQHGFGESNRLELDLGFGRHTVLLTSQATHATLTGAYHWDFNIVSGFNWFIGPAVQVGLYNHTSSSLTVGIGGQGGVEFDFNEFDVPILVGIDARPIWGFTGGTSGLGYGGSASVRYTF